MSEIRKPGGQPKFKPEFIEEMRALAEAGVRDEEIAAYFGVNRVTLWRWAAEYPEFYQARERKREIARLPFGRHRLYKPEFAGKAQKLAEMGYNDAAIARLLGVNGSTIWRWQREYPEFGAAVQAGRVSALR